MAIDIGSGCNNDNDISAGYTRVDEANPANAAGTVDSCCVYVGSVSVEGIQYAVFTDNGSNSLTCKAGHYSIEDDLTAPTPGVTTHTSAGNDFTAFNTDSGEYIGIYFTAGDITGNPGGVGVGEWYLSGDQISDNNTQTFTYAASWRLGLAATGVEANGGLSIPVAMHSYRQRRNN